MKSPWQRRLRRILLLAAFAVLASCKKSPCPDDAVVVGAAPPDGLSQWCQRTNGEGSVIRHGRYRKWYPSGQIAEDVIYVNGEMDGRATRWTEDGKKEETLYEHGAEVQTTDFGTEGFVVTYNTRDGGKNARIEAKNGDVCDVRVEPYVWNCRYKDGGPKFKLVGQPPEQSMEMYYKNGKLAISRANNAAPWISYAEDGKRIEARPEDGPPTETIKAIMIDVSTTMGTIMRR